MPNETLWDLIREDGPLFPQYREDYARTLVSRIKAHPEDMNGELVASLMLRDAARDVMARLMAEVGKRQRTMEQADIGAFYDGFSMYARIVYYTYIAVEGGLEGTREMLRTVKQQSDHLEQLRLGIVEDYLMDSERVLRRDPTGVALSRWVLDSEARRRTDSEYRAGSQCGFYYWCFWRETLENLGYNRL